MNTDQDRYRLHRAAFRGRLENVRFLIQDGADVNATNKDYKQTPLHIANEGHLEIAKLLVEKRAKVNATDKHGKTPLHNAETLEVPNS